MALVECDNTADSRFPYLTRNRCKGDVTGALFLVLAIGQANSGVRVVEY